MKPHSSTTPRSVDPLAQVATWVQQARSKDPEYGHAMVLSSVNARGAPSSRVVLLKDCGPDGLVFFTNYESRKGRELGGNGAVSLVMWWKEYGRQIRVEGDVTQVPRADSEAYFATRPRGSQLGAWASRQSCTISSRATLLQRLRAVTRRFRGRPVPCPPHWGGYRVVPHTIEFWSDRRNRLHERIVYQRRGDGRWSRRLLSP